MNEPRYEAVPSVIEDGHYCVIDRKRHEAVKTRMFGRQVTYYKTLSAAHTVADALNKEDMMNYDDTYVGTWQVFYIFRRDNGTSYVPTGWASRRLPVTETGAKMALAEALKDSTLEPKGTYLVQGPHGAWIFEVTPPEPAAPTLTVV